MNKSGTLITAALLSLGLVAGAMAADMPKAADTPAAGAAAPAATDAPKTRRLPLLPLLPPASNIAGTAPRPPHGGRGVFLARARSYIRRYKRPHASRSDNPGGPRSP